MSLSPLTAIEVGSNLTLTLLWHYDLTDIYHVSFRQERAAIWMAVYALFLLDIIQSVSVTDQAWLMVCKGWGREDILDEADWSYVAIPIVSGLCECLP